jgi:hypothetical protein
MLGDSLQQESDNSFELSLSFGLTYRLPEQDSNLRPIG